MERFSFDFVIIIVFVILCFLGNKTGVNLNNEDPFKLMEINAIKTALQKTKGLCKLIL